MMLDAGLVLMSDTRTNSGVDNISIFRKMFSWQVPGDRIITMMTAGNLATTQAVISQLEERNKVPGDRHPSILEAPTMFQIASEVGRMLRAVIEGPGELPDPDEGPQAEGKKFTASIILGGQIHGMQPRLFLIYPEGNFIEASFDTPFFQIGETKYGRPIILRGYDRQLSFENAVKLLMVSFDSTLKANLSVGMPLDMMVIERNCFTPLHAQRVTDADPYFRQISSGWGEALKRAMDALPPFIFDGDEVSAADAARTEAASGERGHSELGAAEKAVASVK
jgi:putative proteasome-type protease